jgi:hypothetical protein
LQNLWDPCCHLMTENGSCLTLTDQQALNLKTIPGIPTFPFT